MEPMSEKQPRRPNRLMFSRMVASFGRSVIAFAAFLCLAAPHSAVGGPLPDPGTAIASSFHGGKGILELTDSREKRVMLHGVPNRIVVAGKASFMITDALFLFPEARSRVVGQTKEGQGMESFLSILQPGFASQASLGREAGPEQIAAVKPDVVLMKKASAENLGKPLEALGIPVVCVDFETPGEYPRDLAILGRLLGQEPRAGELKSMIDAAISRIGKGLSGVDLARSPRVLLLYYSVRDGAVAFNVPPKSWMQTLLVKMAGGNPVWEDAQLGQGWTKVGFEQIAAWDPDQVFIVSYFAETSQVIAELKADPGWQALRAAKAGKLWAFPGDLISWDQPDPRWVLGMTWLAGKIHPERFPNLDMTAEAVTFFTSFFGADAEAVRKGICPKIHGDL